MTANADVAALVSDTVQVEVPLGFSTVGRQLNDDRAAGAVNPRENVADPPLRLAVRVALVALVTAVAVAVKLAVVAPPFTATEAGTVAEALLLDRLTLKPPAGAAELKVTVQALVPGVATEAGVQLKLAGWTSGLTVMLAVRLTPAADAVMVAVVELETDPAVAVKVLLVDPEATVTVAGTVTAA